MAGKQTGFKPGLRQESQLWRKRVTSVKEQVARDSGLGQKGVDDVEKPSR